MGNADRGHGFKWKYLLRTKIKTISLPQNESFMKNVNLSDFTKPWLSVLGFFRKNHEPFPSLELNGYLGIRNLYV